MDSRTNLQQDEIEKRLKGVVESSGAHAFVADGSGDLYDFRGCRPAVEDAFESEALSTCGYGASWED